MIFKKSSYSTMNGQCLETAVASDGVFVRDSKDPVRMTGFSQAAWAAFLKGVKQ